MSDLDVLRVPEPVEKKTELDKFTHRSWWCHKFHDRYLYTVGFSYPKGGGVRLPIKVCSKCIITERCM